MTTKTFSHALGEIGDKYISEATSYTAAKKKNSWMKWSAMAACLCLMLVAFPVIRNLTNTQDADTIELVEVIEWPEARVEKKLIGEYRGNILHSWGEPDVTLTDTNADQYYLDEDSNRYIILYYDNEGYITEFALEYTTTLVPLPGGILAEVTKLIDNGSCEVVVTGEDSNFSNGDTLTIHYNFIQENSEKTNKQLEVGDIIAVTYASYEETDGVYSISVEYVDLIEPTE